MAAQYKRAQRCRSKLEKILSKTLEDSQNSCGKRKDSDQEVVSFGFLGSALIEEQPELTQKTNKPIAQKKKKKRKRNMTVIFTTRAQFLTRMLTKFKASQNRRWMRSFAYIRQVKTASSDDRAAEGHASFFTK